MTVRHQTSRANAAFRAAQEKTNTIPAFDSHSFNDDNGITGLDWSLSEVVFRQFPTGRFQNCCTAAALSKQG
ncbi:MAG: hypothetical protein IJH81_00695 [Lachnospiraceae bacterium]|nr:hypothetical protein [Lachnospiraceae bacterium]